MNARKALELLVSEFDQYHDGASNDHHLRLAIESAREALASEPESVEAPNEDDVLAAVEAALYQSPDINPHGDEKWMVDELLPFVMKVIPLLATHAKPPEPDGYITPMAVRFLREDGVTDNRSIVGKPLAGDRHTVPIYIGKPTGADE